MVDYAVRITITGKVQGVGFRWWAVNNASTFGLNGWVRNRNDGSVEALLSGEKNAIDGMIKRCHIGPTFAVVKNLQIEELNTSTVQGFTQLPTI